MIRYAPAEAPFGQELVLDQTYVKLKGQWKYLYRAVDKEGNTVPGPAILLLTSNERAVSQCSGLNLDDREKLRLRSVDLKAP